MRLVVEGLTDECIGCYRIFGWPVLDVFSDRYDGEVREPTEFQAHSLQTQQGQDVQEEGDECAPEHDIEPREADVPVDQDQAVIDLYVVSQVAQLVKAGSTRAHP